MCMHSYLYHSYEIRFFAESNRATQDKPFDLTTIQLSGTLSNDMLEEYP